jgi:hypothetical protein
MGYGREREMNRLLNPPKTFWSQSPKAGQRFAANDNDAELVPLDAARPALDDEWPATKYARNEAVKVERRRRAALTPAVAPPLSLGDLLATFAVLSFHAPFLLRL